MNTSQVGLRPFLMSDAEIAAAIFVASIEELTGDDYSEAQQRAWADVAEDDLAFGRTLAAQLTLIATLHGAPVGFASLKGNDHIDMLYVHPSVVRQGVASALCDALEKLAAARGGSQPSVDASDNARTFFLRRGYIDERRSTITIGDEWLARTRMKKVLDVGGGAT